MKLKITKNKNFDQLREEAKCKSCNGSGYYDWANPRTGKVPPCAACNGTEIDSPAESTEDR